MDPRPAFPLVSSQLHSLKPILCFFLCDPGIINLLQFHQASHSVTGALSVKMTRSHKYNDRDHSGEGDDNHIMPKYFAKHGFVDTDPKKTKKDGGGKGNWGHPGAEVEDFDVNMTKARRRSNSSTLSRGAKDFKSKFEVVEPEPVFEDMPLEDVEDEAKTDMASNDHLKLEQLMTESSTSSGQSIDEEQS